MCIQFWVQSLQKLEHEEIIVLYIHFSPHKIIQWEIRIYIRIIFLVLVYRKCKSRSYLYVLNTKATNYCILLQNLLICK